MTSKLITAPSQFYAQGVTIDLEYGRSQTTLGCRDGSVVSLFISLLQINFYNLIVVAGWPPYQNYVLVWKETSKQCKIYDLHFFNCEAAPDLRVFLNVYKQLMSNLSFVPLSPCPSFSPAFPSSCNLTFSFLITLTSPSFLFHSLSPLPPLCCSALLFPPYLLPFTNTLLFSRASQGHCEITYFTDPLSSVTLPTHQTADPLTLSLCVCLSVCLSLPVSLHSQYFRLCILFLPFSPQKTTHSQNTQAQHKNTDVYKRRSLGNYICDAGAKQDLSKCSLSVHYIYCFRIIVKMSHGRVTKTQQDERNCCLTGKNMVFRVYLK